MRLTFGRPNGLLTLPEKIVTENNAVSELQWVENALLRLLAKSLPNRCMIDVGAHHGTSLAPFIQSGRPVIAFEPIEANRVQLQANFAGAPGLVIRSEAVSDSCTTKEFHLALNLDGTLHEYHHSFETFNEDAWHKKGPVVQVETISLDALIARGEVPPTVGLLKIDTEGHDLAVLKGASTLQADAISVEFWEDEHTFGPSPSPASAMIQVLSGRGYHNFIVLWHERDGTNVCYSSLADLPRNAWGNLFFFHESQKQIYDSLLHDPDWLFTIEMSRRFAQLLDQLRSKESIIADLSKAANDRLLVINELSQAAAERLLAINELSQAAANRRKVAEERLQIIDELSKVAAERLQVIQKLKARQLKTRLRSIAHPILRRLRRLLRV